MTDPSLESQARAAAEVLGLPLAPAPSCVPAGDDRLILSDLRRWSLADGEGRRLRIDFDGNRLDYFRRAHRGLKEPLARAVGGDKGLRRIWDLSAGLGIDAVFLSQLGFEVTAFERDPVVAFLLREALAVSKREDLRRLHFEKADAREKISGLKNSDEIETLYFDPMYPERRKKALSRQEMELFRRRVGDDADAAEIVALALTAPVCRVVVKRPLRAEPLSPRPQIRFEGTTVRFDVYVRNT